MGQIGGKTAEREVSSHHANAAGAGLNMNSGVNSVMNFTGRERELDQLETHLLRVERPTIGVIYGRRRIGKSALIRQSLSHRNVLFFEGLEGLSTRHQIKHFVTQLCYQVQIPRPTKEPATWLDSLLLLNDVLKTQARNGTHYDVVFDELQWLANYRSELISSLKLVWDQYLSTQSDINLILCGSIASFMVKKVINKSAFYGRADLVLHLKQFTLAETKMLMPKRGANEILLAYLLTGGVPKYLELLDRHGSIVQGMDTLCFAETGYFVAEYERIFLSHFGKNLVYQSIVKSLLRHPYGRSRVDIAADINIRTGGQFSAQLGDLEAAGFIASMVPLSSRKRQQRSSTRRASTRYILSDAYLRFYFQFISEELQQIRSGVMTHHFIALSQTNSFASWLGHALEHLCYFHAVEIARLLGFESIAYEFGPYYDYRSGSPLQLDLVFKRADNVLTICEVKYSNSTIGVSIIDQVDRQRRLLQDSFPKQTIQSVLITNAPVSVELERSSFFYRIVSIDELFSMAR